MTEPTTIGWAELQQLAARINAIVAQYRLDPEMAHVAEDVLMADLVQQYCPEPVRKAMARLLEAPVTRWYA